MVGSTPLKIVVVGAGLGGLAVAVAARLQGLEVTVLESACKLGEVSHIAMYIQNKRLTELDRSARASSYRRT